jgi:predicted ATPase
VQLVAGDDANPWTYTLEIMGSESKRKPMRVQKEEVLHGERVVLRRPDGRDKTDDLLLTQTHLEQKSQNGQFRPLADALASVEHVHIVPQVAKSVIRAEELARKEAPGSDFIEQLARLPEKRQGQTLRRIEQHLRHAVPRFSELRVERDEVGRPHLEAKYQHWRLRGGWQNEQELSDGTLRLIGLLWALELSSGPLVVEEPELSLHADVVRQLPRVLTRAAQRSGRQFVVSTHAEDMLADRGIDPSEIILLEPTEHETKAIPGDRRLELLEAARRRMPLARAVRSITRPANIDQLGLPGIG